LSLKETHDFTLLHNAAEEWVLQVLEEELSNEPELYESQEAVLDIMALALNKIKPYYFVTLLGNLYAHAPDEETMEEIRQAVKKAMKKIRKDE